jgi:ribosomal protein S4
MKLFLKGDRCYTKKCAIEAGRVTPGQHGQSRKKATEYGLQFREKQKAKRIYGMQERQFKITWSAVWTMSCTASASQIPAGKPGSLSGITILP